MTFAVSSSTASRKQPTVFAATARYTTSAAAAPRTNRRYAFAKAVTPLQSRRPLLMFVTRSDAFSIVASGRYVRHAVASSSDATSGPANGGGRGIQNKMRELDMVRA